MTIHKGQQWGDLRVPPEDLVIADSDAELRHILDGDDAWPPVVGLSGGDLMRTVGGSGHLARFTSGQPLPHLPIDVVRVVADESRETLFVAHLVARRGWWRGEVWAAMNAEFFGTWDLVPRGHPNDGKIDIVTASADLSVRQRSMTRRRLKIGTHMPHPHISMTSRASATIQLAEATPLWLDGERWERAQRIDLTVVPDAITICV